MSQYAVLAIVTDCALIDIGLNLAVAARLQSFRALSTYMHHPATLRIVFVILTCVVVFYHSGLYDFRFMSRRRYGARSEILARLLRAFGIVVLALAVFYFVFPELSMGRFALLAAPLILVLTLGWRLMLAPCSPQLRF